MDSDQAIFKDILRSWDDGKFHSNHAKSGQEVTWASEAFYRGFDFPEGAVIITLDNSAKWHTFKSTKDVGKHCKKQWSRKSYSIFP